MGREGLRFATATVVRTERSAPRDPGAALAVSERGDVAGSVTGGCVEPAVYEEARQVLAGGEPRLRTYGIADEEAFEVGLPCGGTVQIFVGMLEPGIVTGIACKQSGTSGRSRSSCRNVEGRKSVRTRLVYGDARRTARWSVGPELLARGPDGLLKMGGEGGLRLLVAPWPEDIRLRCDRSASTLA